MSNITIGVIAGTPVDTQMGIDFFKEKGMNAIGKQTSESPEAQILLQVLHKQELAEIFISVANELIDKGARSIVVYCNSLSGAIDLEYVRSKIKVKVITPLDVYKSTAKNYDRIGVLAANGQSLAAIEKVLCENNDKIAICGAVSVFLIKAIESGESPIKIYTSLKIKELVESLEAMGIQGLILGCTHFPYIEKEIKENTNIDVINPGDNMLKMALE